MPHFPFPLPTRQHRAVLTHHKLFNTSTTLIHSFSSPWMSSGHFRRSLGKLPNPQVPAFKLRDPSAPAEHTVRRSNTLQQDYNWPRSCSLSCWLWRYHQPLQVHLRQPTHLHNEDNAAGLAHLHRVSYYETEVRYTTRSIFPVPVWQWVGEREREVHRTWRLRNVHCVRRRGYRCKWSLVFAALL
jgi:hypothetical protein